MDNAKTPSKFLDRCISEYLPTLKSEHATGNVFLLYNLLAETSNQETGFHFPLKDDIVRFALTTTNDSLAVHAAATTVRTLFTAQAIRYPEQAIPEQVAVAERCLEVVRVRGASAAQAIYLLRCLLQNSVDYEQRAGVPQIGELSERPIFVGANTEEYSERITAFVYTGQNQPSKRFVHINKDTKATELHAAISAATGFTIFIVIAGGQLQELTSDSSITVSDKGLLDKGTLIIKRRNTPHSVQEDWDKKIGRTAVERAAFRHFDELFAYVDDSDTLSEQVSLFRSPFHDVPRRYP